MHSLNVTISSVGRKSNYDFQYQTFCPFYYEASSITRLRLEGKEAPRVSQDIKIHTNFAQPTHQPFRKEALSQGALNYNSLTKPTST